jgi:polyhydroxybutyrate depolymerase
MYNHDFHHTRAFRTKRLAAWICVAFSLLIIIGVFFYSLQAGIIPGLRGVHISLPGSSGFGPASINGNCDNQPKGDKTISISSGGQTRSFIIHLPPSYGEQLLPIVFNYHGWDSSAAHYESYTNMGAEADKENFIVVFPQGALDSLEKPSWNAGNGANGPTGSTDDVQFTRDMISYLQHNYCIDTHRIYVTGYSIGASMAYRVACTLTNQIAGLATVEGAFYHFDGGCLATRPIPVLEIHGLADQYAIYDGNSSLQTFPVQTFLNLWFGVDQCNTSNKQTIFQRADVTGYKWPACANGTVVEHYIISDGGHVWAGAATPQPSLGYTTHTIDANIVILNFFSQFKA